MVYTRSAVQEATTATIKVTDNASASKTIEIAIGAVTEPAAELSFEDKEEYDIPAGKKGETYTATVALTATGGTEPYTFTVDPEVTGLSINGENKLVYTRSAVQEATTATIKVTDNASASKTNRNCNWSGHRACPCSVCNCCRCHHQRQDWHSYRRPRCCYYLER